MADRRGDVSGQGESAALALCVIGGGSIGLRHATQALAADGVRLSAVVEPHPARRAELAAMGLPAVADLDAVPPETRAAVVATPTPDHLASGLAAIDHGWAALVEKPLAQTLEQADRLCAAAEAKGTALIAGHHRRCHPFVAAARDRLGAIGALVALEGLWSLRKHDTYYDTEWRRQPGAGPILTNLSHEIDLLQFLAGEIVEVFAMTANARRGLAVEDTAAISFRFANGALGNFLLSDAGASPWAFEAATGENPEIAVSGQDPVRLIGTEGALSFPSLTLWQAAEPGEIDWRKPMRAVPGPKLPQVDPIRVQLERFARMVAGADDPLLATGRDGRATVAVTEAVLTSARTRQPQTLTSGPQDDR